MRTKAFTFTAILLALLLTEAGLAQTKQDTLIIQFAFNSSSISSSDASQLSNFLLQSIHKTDSILIIGYTDTIGSIPYNNSLSLSRAHAAARLIGSKTKTPFSVAARGESEPVAGEESLSRRVLVIKFRSEQLPAILAQSKTEQVPVEPINNLVHSIASGTATPDTTIGLTNINFIENSPILTPSSIAALPGNIRSLKKYQSAFLEIFGYCNSNTPITSTEDPLYKLSVKRARVIYEYLTEAGFDPAKMSYKGMGNANAINKHPGSDDEARVNMRVEINIYNLTKGKPH